MKFFRFLNAANVLKELPYLKRIAILQIISSSDFFKLISILRGVFLPAIFFQELLNVRKIQTLSHLVMKNQSSIQSNDNKAKGNLKEDSNSDQKHNPKIVLALSFNALIISHATNASLLTKILSLRASALDCNLKGKYQIIIANALFKQHKHSELLSLVPISENLQPFTALLLSKACMHSQNHQQAEKLYTQALKPIFQRELSNMNRNTITPLIMKKIRTTYEALLKCMSTFFKTHQFSKIQNLLIPLLQQFFLKMSSSSNHEMCMKFNINIKDGLLQLIKGWSKNQKRIQSWDCYQIAQQYITNVRQSQFEISLFFKKASCLRAFIECQLTSSPKFQIQYKINQLFEAHYNDLDISCYGSAIRITTQNHNEKLSIKLFNDLVSRVQTSLLQNSNTLFDKSEKIIENSKQQVHKMPQVQIAINQLLDTLAKKGKMNEALNILNGISEVLCKTQIYPLSTVPFNQILEALMRTGQVRRGWDFFEEKIYESGVKLDNFTLSALAKGITKECHAQNLDRLLNIIDKQFNQKHNESADSNKVEIIVFNVIMLGCININQPQRAVQVFKMLNFQQDYDLDRIRMMKNLKDPENLVLQRNYTPIFNTLPDIVSYNTLIKASLKFQKFNSAFSFYELLKLNKRVKANDVTYNTLIDGCTKTPHQMYLGWELLQEMCRNNIQPDSFTYSSLVKGIKKYGNNQHTRNNNGLDSALKFLNSLLTQGIQNQAADEVLYNSVMDTCIHFKKFDKALELFNQMKERKIEPSSVTYGILIKGFGQSRQIKRAIQIYEQMSKKCLQPNQVTYGCLIDACVNNNKMNKAIELFNSLQEASYNSPVKGANTIIYTTLIKGFTRQRDLNSALQLYYQMKDEANPNCEPNNVTFNSLIDCCVRVGNLKVAEEIMNELQNHPKLSPDLITFSTMIKGYCQNGMIAVAFEMLDNMIAKYNITPDEVLFNSLLDGCFRSDAYDIGNMVFERMRSANLLMTEISYSIMIKMYGKQAEIDKAFGLLQELKQKKMNSGVILYTCLIKACFQQQENQRAIQAFQMLKQEGNLPDKVVYQTMIQGLLFAGKNRMTKENQECLLKAGEYVIEAYDVYRVQIVQDLREQLLIAVSEQSGCDKFKELAQGIIRVGKMSGGQSQSWSSSYSDKYFHYDRQSINHVYHHHKMYNSRQCFKRGGGGGGRKNQNVNKSSINNGNNFSFQKKKYSKPMYVKKEQVSANQSSSSSSQEQEVKSVRVETYTSQTDDKQTIDGTAPLKRQDYQNILTEKSCQNRQNISKGGDGYVKRSGGYIGKENSESQVQQQYQDQQNINYHHHDTSGKYRYYNKFNDNTGNSSTTKGGAKKNTMKFNQQQRFTRL